MNFNQNFNLWDAVFFHPSLQGGILEAGRKNGKIQLESDALRGQTSTGETFSIAFQRLTFRMEKEVITLLSSQDPQLRITVKIKDASILEELKQTGAPHLIEEVNRLQKKITLKRTFFIGTIAFTLFFIFIGFPLLAFYGATFVTAVLPISVDEELGQTLKREMVKHPLNSNYPEADLFLKELVKRLTDQLPQNSYSYKVHLVDSSEMNAFALPGGQIIVHTGLLKKSKRLEEVAGVLAHEIVHVYRRHGVKKVVQQVGTGIVLLTIFGNRNQRLVNGAQELQGSKFSRDMEREADQMALDILVKAQIEPSGLKTFFETLAQEEKNSAYLNIFGSHPLTPERIQYLDSRLKEIGSISTKPLSISWEKLQEELQ